MQALVDNTFGNHLECRNLFDKFEDEGVQHAVDSGLKPKLDFVILSVAKDLARVDPSLRSG